MTTSENTPRTALDRRRLRVQLRYLDRWVLLELLDRGVHLISDADLHGVVDGLVDPTKAAPDGASGPRLIDVARRFRDASLRGAYYQDFDVTSKNCLEYSRGTEAWAEECQRLFDHAAIAAQEGRRSDAKPVFDVLFGLLRYIDEAHDDVLFFADEGGSQELGLDWQDALPAYFTCLSPDDVPDEYARKTDQLHRFGESAGA